MNEKIINPSNTLDQLSFLGKNIQEQEQLIKERAKHFAQNNTHTKLHISYELLINIVPVVGDLIGIMAILEKRIEKLEEAIT